MITYVHLHCYQSNRNKRISIIIQPQVSILDAYITGANRGCVLNLEGVIGRMCLKFREARSVESCSCLRPQAQ